MTTQLFINYNPVAGATINTYRNNGNWHDNDLAGFLSDAVRENIATCSVDLCEAQYALMDGEFLATINAPCQDQLQAVAEDLHFAISCWPAWQERRGVCWMNPPYGREIAVSDQSHGFEQALILKR